MRRWAYALPMWSQAATCACISAFEHYSTRGGGRSGFNLPTVRAPTTTSSSSSSVSIHEARATSPRPRDQRSSSSSRVFWKHNVSCVAQSDIKRSYLADRAADRQSRFVVRKALPNDGALSNLYPIHFHEGKADAPSSSSSSTVMALYVYEMYVVKSLPSSVAASPAKKPTARGRGTSARVEGESSTPRKRRTTKTESSSSSSQQQQQQQRQQRVSAKSAWWGVGRHLRAHCAPQTPLVKVQHQLFTTAALPTHLLQIPRELWDLGWEVCELRLVGRYGVSELSSELLQMLCNEIVRWAVRQLATTTTQNAPRNDFLVVRERSGKLVCTSGGISAAGVRVYRGIIAQALFITEGAGGTQPDVVSGGSTSPSSTTSSRPSLSSTDLKDAAIGLNTNTSPISFSVAAFLRAFTYKGRCVESYRLEDASGIYLASVWEPRSAPAFVVGEVYRATGVMVREFAERDNLRLFEFQPGIAQVVKVDEEEDVVAPTTTTTTTTTAAARRRAFLGACA